MVLLYFNFESRNLVQCVGYCLQDRVFTRVSHLTTLMPQKFYVSSFKFYAPKTSDHFYHASGARKKIVMGLMAQVLHRVFGNGPKNEIGVRKIPVQTICNKVRQGASASVNIADDTADKIYESLCMYESCAIMVG